VVFLVGIANIPALLIRKSILGKVMASAKDLMDCLLARLSSMNSTVLLGFSFLHFLMTCSAVVLSLAPIMTEHPFLAKNLVVYAPIPELPPVMTAYFPLRSRVVMLHIPPLK